MNSIDSLTIRTTTALGRLSTLQRRAEKGAGGSPSVLREALQELSVALEELQTANDQLTDQVEQLSAARLDADGSRRQFEHLFSLMPTPCAFTDADGRITEANARAATLLNVGRPHLTGKSLFLFFMEREALVEATCSQAVSFERVIVVRPRERRPRPLLVRGHRLDGRGSWCWFLEPAPEPQEKAGQE